MSTGGREAGLVHKSAHPNLPPAAPQQVVQYLLAKNFHLTALELLVEAQQAGHGDDVRDLEAFFADPERFPPEELARHQPSHAFDLQAAGRERESRLQMAEYELRLAKEDLAEMARKLDKAQQQQQQAATATPATSPGVASAASAASRTLSTSLSSSVQSPSTGAADRTSREVGARAAGGGPAGGGGAADTPPPAPATLSCTAPPSMPTPAEQRALNAAVFAHLLRQGLVTTAMTMEEEYGGPLRPAGHPSPSPTSTHGASDPSERWDLWAWYHAAQTGAAAVTAAGGAGAAGAGVQAAEVAAALATVDLQPSELLDLESALDPDLDPKEDVGSLSEGASPEDLRAQLLAARRQVADTRARARAALAAAQKQLAAAAAAAATARSSLSGAGAGAGAAAGGEPLLASPAPASAALQPPLLLLTEDAAVLDLLDLGSSVASTLLPNGTSSSASAALGATNSANPATASPPHPSALKPRPASPSAAAEDSAGRVPADGSPEAQGPPARPPWLRDIDMAHLSSLEELLSRMCEALPRLVPNLTLKSRVDVLPLMVAAAKTTNDWSVRQHLLGAVFNLAPAPDHQQRQAIIEACLDLCRAFGSGWAASELLQLCCRQAGSPSSERRTLVAEALGACVGVVDAGTQAHVLLTQLTQLAKDRLDQVREAACLSLARLVPRLPFSRSYYIPLEGLLMPLAMDGSEAVHSAALSYLVPALLTWQPQDTDSLLVSSCLARVLSEVGQQVSMIEHQQAQAAKAAAVAAGGIAAGDHGGGGAVTSNGGGLPSVTTSSFGGAFLRYSLAGSGQQQQQQQAGAAAGASEAAAGAGGAGGGGGGGEHAGGPQPSPASQSATAPPPQSVTFGRRTFPSLSHLALYQLLGLYCGLAPALRHAALRSKPSWAGPATSIYAAGTATAGPQSHLLSRASGHNHPLARHHLHHQRAGSYGTLAAAAAAAAAGGAGDPTLDHSDNAAAARGGAGLAPSHRRTSSHPATLASFNPSTAGNNVCGGGFAGIGTRGPLPPLPPTPIERLADTAVAGGAGAAGGGVSRRSSSHDGPGGGVVGEELDRVSPSSPRVAHRRSGVGEGGAEGEAEGEAEGAEEEEEEAGAAGGADWDEGEEAAHRSEEDAALACWATHASHGGWKTLEWVMQHVVPELLRLVGAVGPSVPEAVEVRWQAAGAVAATCSALGPLFTQVAVVPVFQAASGAGCSVAGGALVAPATCSGEVDAPMAVRDLCSGIQPRSVEALRAGRQCVLPVLLAAVLPSAHLLRPHLEQLMGSAHELRQRWLLEALPDYTAALTFAGNLRPDLVAEVLKLFEDLLSGNTSAAAAAAAPHSGEPGAGGNRVSVDSTRTGDVAATAATASSSSSGGPASTAVGLCCAALARALVPLATLEMTSRRLLPGLMALMSYGEPELQRACVGVLAELGLRFRGDGPRVSEQVLVVYDSLLEQGGPVVQLEVLAAGTTLAAAAAPSAAVSAAAAAQVEWLLTAVQAMAVRLVAPGGGGVGGGGAAGGAPSVDHQRAAAAQLLAALRAVAPYDLRLPRLQANLHGALDALQRCKSLLPDPQQQAALTSLLKERPAGPSAGGTSISSSSQGTASTPLRGGPPNTPPPPASSTPVTGSVSSSFFASSTAAPPGGATHGSVVGGGATPVPHSPFGGVLPPGVVPAAGSPAPGGAAAAAGGADGQGASAQLRSRFDAFKLRLLKRRDDVPAAAGGQPPNPRGAAGGSERPKESFFSDDEGD